jgi:acetyltransferase-like isoleucine patch superfamily enzyme
MIPHLYVSPRLRLFNWFVQRVIYGCRNLPCNLNFTSRVTVADKLKIGRDVRVSLASSGSLYIQAVNGVEIGDDTLIAPGVKIISSNHRIGDLIAHDVCEPIRIGKRCWLGANAIILPGVQLGDDTVVAAGAVVTKSFPSGCVVAGVPAKVIREVGASPTVEGRPPPQRAIEPAFPGKGQSEMRWRSGSG